jgi:uncharacterized protein (TIGR03435 family)
VTLLVGVVAAGQAPAVQSPKAADTPAFDVASVKPNKSTDEPNSNFPLGPGNVYVPNGGYFSATSHSLFDYILFAYKITGYQMQALQSQLPGWVTADRFDIQARVKGNPTKDQMRLMMQSLLAERFKLAIHNETRPVPVFGLLLLQPGKTGPQLQPHPDGASCATTPASAAGTAPSPTVPGGFPTLCGGILNMPPSAPGRWRIGARNVTMGVIATALGLPLGRPVLDETGLSGNFDFALEWTPEPDDPMPPLADFQTDPSGPSLLGALKEQLGLKLESQKGPADVIVIDHVERPSEN